MTQSPPALLKLSDLSMRVDIVGFYTSHGCIVSGKPTNSKEGKEYAASCPRCGGTDRFSFWDSGRFCCIRGNCNNWHGSSPYWLLRDEGYEHLEALEELGIEPEEVDSYSSNNTVKLPLFLTKDEPPSKKWQEQAHLMCHVWQKILWTSQGESARAYLHSRGFTDETIKNARLGLNPDWYKAPLEKWGLDASQLNKEDDPQIKIPRGIVIPWFVGNDSIWKIQLRRPEAGPDGKKYKEVLGSSNCLYMPRGYIEPGQALMMVESELDALSAYQEASDLVQVVATGSTSKNQTPQAVTLLHQASFILQSFDDDDAGQRGAEAWQRLIPGIQRWAPWAHDVNQMLQEDISIRDWVELGLISQEEPETLEDFWESCTPDEPPALQSFPEKEQRLNPAKWNWMQKNERGLASLCLKCYQPATYWDNQGEPYCRNCCPWANEWPYARRAS